MLTKRHFIAGTALSLCHLALVPNALAHGARVGSLRIEHPYALPSPTEPGQWLIFLRGIRNSGNQADRLVGAITPVASEVVLQRALAPKGKEPLAIPAIDLPPLVTTPMRHDLGEYRLLLRNLKQPIKAGDRFDLSLTFQNAGTETVKVYVQTAPDSPLEKHH